MTYIQKEFIQICINKLKDAKEWSFGFYEGDVEDLLLKALETAKH